MIERHLTKTVLRALADTPVVLLHGPRQCGKSTLVRWLAEHEIRATYLTLDDASVLSAAIRDPETFLHAVRGPMVIDEVQLAPDLFRAMKLDIDRKREPGRFLLTGSANVMMLPRLSEALVGRMEVLALWPFSQGELSGVREQFVDRLFELSDLGRLACRDISPTDLLKRIVAGGYPEVVQRPDTGRRRAWFGAYVTTILQRDVRDLSQIEDLTSMPRLLSVLAAQSGGLLNMAELSRSIGLSQPTIKRHLTLLRATHLYQPLPAWSGSVRKRLLKSEKAFMNDTGLTAYLLGLDDSTDLSSPRGGMLLEAFVCQELRKQIGWSQVQPSMWYYRTAAGREVDFVLERRNGQLVGLEVKTVARVRIEDFKGLVDLADATGERFRAGVLLYQGNQTLPFGPKMWAVPLTAMFSV